MGKSQIRNKSEFQSLKCPKPAGVWRLGQVLIRILNLFRILNFGFRIHAKPAWSPCNQPDLTVLWFRDIFTSRLSVFVNKLSA